MTLFIAWLVIYAFDLSAWLYVLAAIVWIAEVLWRMRGEGKILADLKYLTRKP